MSMGLVLLIFDQGPNPGPSSDRNYLFANFASSNFPWLALFLLSSIWIWWISWILWMSIDLVTWGIQHTRPALTNKNQQSLHVFQINFSKLPVTSSQNMIISPREQRAELCTVVLSMRLLGFCELVSEFGKSAACCPELSGGCRCSAVAVLNTFVLSSLPLYFRYKELQCWTMMSWHVTGEAMSQHVTCHVHMFVSIWPVDVSVWCLHWSGVWNWLSSLARALPPCPLPRQLLTPQLLSLQHCSHSCPAQPTYTAENKVLNTTRPLEIFSSCSF